MIHGCRTLVLDVRECAANEGGRIGWLQKVAAALTWEFETSVHRVWAASKKIGSAFMGGTGYQ